MMTLMGRPFPPTRAARCDGAQGAAGRHSRHRAVHSRPIAREENASPEQMPGNARRWSALWRRLNGRLAGLSMVSSAGLSLTRRPASPEARQRRDAANADLAAVAPATKVVEVQPAAVTRYLGAIDDLATTLSRRSVEGDEAVASALRELISAVVIHPGGKDEPKIAATGRLAQLTSAPDLFPQQTLWPTVVAGARFVHSRHLNETGDQPLGFVFILPGIKARR